MSKNILGAWKKNNRKVSGQLINSSRYWNKSPSNILLYPAIAESFRKYAKNKNVLDAGAGRLAYKNIITQFAKKYTSFDFQNTHPELDVVTNIEKMSFKKNSFDVVFCSQVLEHVPHPWKAMSEICRILKPDGIAIITVPHLAYLHNMPYDFFRYTEGGLRSMSRDAGLKVKTIQSLGGFFCFIGHVRSSALMPIFGVPVIGGFVFSVNWIISRIEIKMDKQLKTATLFPLNYILVVSKSQK